MTISSSDIESIKELFGCREGTARHYLEIFGNDRDRAINSVLSYGNDPDWWGHPWNAGCSDARADNGNDGEDESDYDDGDASSANQETEGATASTTRKSRQQEFSSTSADMERDRVFYDRYAELIDGFIDAVCSKEAKAVLRNIINNADERIALDTEMNFRESNLVNRLSYKHNAADGRSPLCYAVAKNLKQQVYDLIDLGADVSKVMPEKHPDESSNFLEETGLPCTALVIAATNAKRDGTEMVRILLSKGADPYELIDGGVDEEVLGLGMKYWIDKARRVRVPSREELEHMGNLPPMDRIHELDYAVVGEEAAVSVIQEALAGRFGNPEGNRKPLVMLLLGPPGHGKTYFSSNTARSLVGEDNFLFVPCQSIRDDADLFGSRLGGSRNGEYSSDGQLTGWLRQRQGKKCIVFLDEFEKMKDLTSSLGWGQAKKIYQSFLEPWNDGTLSDQGANSGGYGTNRHVSTTSAGGQKIDCSQTIWIMTSNWGQNEIINFGENHKARVHKKIDHKDVAWIQKELVKKILVPLCMREIASVHEDLKALCRRIDKIVPFLPFTNKERKVVADVALIERFSLYREPCVLTGPEEKRRLFGNLFLRSTNAFATYVAESYDPFQGASGMLTIAQQADGKFLMKNSRNELGLSQSQKERVKSESAPDPTLEEPIFWVHYDRYAEEITITQSRPADDDDNNSSDADDDGDEYTQVMNENKPHPVDGHPVPPPGAPRMPSGAADDAF